MTNSLITSAMSALSAIRNTRKGARVVYWRECGDSVQVADASIRATQVMRMLTADPDALIGVYARNAAIPMPTLDDLMDDIVASMPDMGLSVTDFVSLPEEALA